MCDDRQPRQPSNALLLLNNTNSRYEKLNFDRCLDNAGVNPGNTTAPTGMPSTATSSVQTLQENP